MATLVLGALTYIQQSINAWRYTAPEKVDNPLKAGVLCADTLDITGLIDPSKTHPDVLLWGLASSSTTTTTSLSSQHAFKRTYASFPVLLSDPQIDFVYISLPTSLRFEWASKALQAGKHVLIGGTGTGGVLGGIGGGAFTSNAQEAEALVKLAEEKGLILNSGTLGKIVKTSTQMTLGTPAVPKDDGRWHYESCGGSLMELGSSVLGVTKFAVGAGDPEKVLFAKAYPAEHDANVDGSMHATLKFSRNSTKKGTAKGNAPYTPDLARPWWHGLIPRIWELPSILVETTHSEVYFYNFHSPHLYHYIAVTDKSTGRTSYEQCYKGGPVWTRGNGNAGEGEEARGEDHWSTHRYMLEAFVDRVRGRDGGRVWWCDGRESVEGMKAVDEVYRACGLPSSREASDRTIATFLFMSRRGWEVGVESEGRGPSRLIAAALFPTRTVDWCSKSSVEVQRRESGHDPVYYWVTIGYTSNTRSRA
ncbi:hypothetical protein FA13DRAFT_1778914 [Coprinellus micaceus]|uniref:D-xylose 1-dehydrogenase (NADP(+), D-xylono-1,5-lactone-forming) n=1 Tax=Coprinellus micaceus TaxID=71717 RepID=A0A4Y7SKE5_COPMI|nr:hypothetical protein FA13DRAFT_1778914 [Coprinellus micaceus]